MVFIISDTAPITIDKVERDPNSVEKLKKFKERVSKGREVVWWENEDELATKVTASLSKQIMKNKRPGWVRAISKNQIKEQSMLLVSQEDYDIDYDYQYDDRTSAEKIDNFKSSVNSIPAVDSEKTNTETSNMVDFMETLEKSIYERHIEVVLPLKVMLEVRTAEYPIEILNEINSAFVHLSKYKLKGSESELKNAFSHMARAEIDAYKYLCISIEDKYDTLINNRKRSILKTESIPYTLIQQNKHAKKVFQYAREREIQGMGIDELRVLYEDVLNHYKERKRNR